MERKIARRERREARAQLKQDDPFSYYFGKVDPDKSPDRALTERKGSTEVTKKLKSFKSKASISLPPKDEVSPLQHNLDLRDIDLDQPSSSEMFSSEEDDKTHPNFWRKDDNYHSLPANVRHAIDKGKLKAKHSEFYYRLKGLNERIYTYKQIFYDKIPVYQRNYMIKQVQKKQEKQKIQREIFE